MLSITHTTQHSTYATPSPGPLNISNFYRGSMNQEQALPTKQEIAQKYKAVLGNYEINKDILKKISSIEKSKNNENNVNKIREIYPFIATSFAIQRKLDLKYFEHNNIDEFFKALGIFIKEEPHSTTKCLLHINGHGSFMEVCKNKNDQVSIVSIDSMGNCLNIHRSLQKMISSDQNMPKIAYTVFYDKIQSTPNCHTFALSFASKSDKHKQFFQNLHQQNFDYIGRNNGIRDIEDIKQSKDFHILDNLDEHDYHLDHRLFHKAPTEVLPASFFKHTQTRDVLYKLSNIDKNKIMERREKHLNSSYSISITNKRDTIIEKAIEHAKIIDKEETI